MLAFREFGSSRADSKISGLRSFLENGVVGNLDQCRNLRRPRFPKTPTFEETVLAVPKANWLIDDSVSRENLKQVDKAATLLVCR